MSIDIQPGNGRDYTWGTTSTYEKNVLGYVCVYPTMTARRRNQNPRWTPEFTLCSGYYSRFPCNDATAPVRPQQVGEREGVGVPDTIKGRSRRTIAPRIRRMPGRSTSDFHRPGRRCLHRSVKRNVRSLVGRLGGELGEGRGWVDR